MYLFVFVNAFNEYDDLMMSFQINIKPICRCKNVHRMKNKMVSLEQLKNSKFIAISAQNVCSNSFNIDDVGQRYFEHFVQKFPFIGHMKQFTSHFKC